MVQKYSFWSEKSLKVGFFFNDGGFLGVFQNN
jgi:hypothetical protein